jgi:hypothetical protein
VRCAAPAAASVSYGYHRFVLALSHLLDVGVLGDIAFSADLVRARNRVVAYVLREPAYSDLEWVLWLDDDQWADDPRVVVEMMGLGVDIVGAPYTNKRHPMRWVHQRLAEPREERDGLLEVRGVGLGFTLVSVRALRQLSEAAEAYVDLPHPHRIPNIFGQLLDDPAGDGRYTLLSEDYSLCRRWRGQGGSVYLYTRAGLIRHAGPHTWDAAQMPGGVRPRTA